MQCNVIKICTSQMNEEIYGINVKTVFIFEIFVFLL